MENVLREIGFTEREIKVYLSMLKLGESTIGPIAKESSIQAAKVYETITKLESKGLASYIIKGKTKYFLVEDPDKLKLLLKQKERNLLEILPKLKERYAHNVEPQVVRIHEGYKAIKILFDYLIDNLNQGDFYYVFSFAKEYLEDEQVPLFFRQIHLKLNEKKIDDKLIGPKSQKKELKELYKTIKSLKLRFSETHFPVGLVITSKSVLQVTWGDRPTVIEICSDNLIKKYKEFFLDMWKLNK